MRVRYDRWSGEQEPFPFAVSADAVLSELHDDLLAGMDVSAALERLARRGFSGRTAGLDDLRHRVEEARSRERSRMGLDEPLRRVAEQLEDIVERERTAVSFSAEPDAAERLAELEALPDDIAARIAALEERRWEDPAAGADFAALVEGLRRDVAEATFGQLAGALGSMSAEDLEAMQALLGDLNALIAKDERGEDVAEDFAAFRERWGDRLPGDPQTLDELLADIARRMAALRSMMAGMSPDQRAQLAAMSSQLLGDLDLAFETDRLQRALESRFPELAWDRAPGGEGGRSGAGGMPGGEPDGSLARAVDWVEHLAELDDLAEQLGQAYPGARLEDIDEGALRRGLGEEAVRDLRALREIERVLEEAGAAQRRAGRLELTPRGVRRLGERALSRIYDRAVDGALGSHRTAAGGGDGELTGATRPLRFGDAFRLDVTRTISKAIMREAQVPGGGVPDDAGVRVPGGGAPRPRAVRLRPEDFELAESERRVRVTTVLLLDMSFSMPLRGNWEPAKRMALALQALVSSKFPEDRFHIVGFSDYARQLSPSDLLVSGWERVYGTNMQHAFMIARRLLAADPGAEQQLIMVTDGEPTAHLEEGARGPWATFAWPPEQKTLRVTMQEAARVARTGATLNVFLLDHDPGAAVFVEAMVRRVGGRIFHPDLDDLGHLVVQDFLHRRAG